MSFEDLIPVVNKLQDIVTTTQVADIDLPLLAVVGSQSCGKSSVLENIVGRDFLPRGTGIVTRRPLVLQLINVKPDDPLVQQGSKFSSPSPEGEVDLEAHLAARNGRAPESSTEWGEFLHIPGKRFYSFGDIRGEIERETARIAGANKGISRLPINLKIYSSRVLNLTLVDLPGLTKIPVGDQPSDIERQTRNLIMEYITKPNAIILAVSPANVDLVNSESLKLARQVDPTGKRTVGILTKLDLMDQGTNAVDILKGNVYPLKLGFIGIVNRSQQDIADNKSLDDSLQTESSFFANHPAYRAMSTRCGTKYLAQTLNRILMGHIRDRLPDIKAKLNTLMGQAEQELASYGDMPSALTDSKEARGAMVLTLMTKFANSFVSSIDGTQNDFSTKELCGGARIYHIYNEVYGNQLARINPTHNLTVQDIRTAIRNSTGPRPSLFVPELAFDLLVKPQISLLENPSKRCVELVYEELMKIVHSVCSSAIGPELGRYPKLQAKLIECVSDLLRERLGPTTKYVESLIEIHRAYINTNHPSFIGAARAMNSVVEERKKQKEVESNHKLRLASERILNSKRGDESEESIEDNDEDINSVDDVIKPPKHAHSNSNSGHRTVSAAAPESESYLNYFFGKDPLVHQQQLAQQAQLNPTPFKFPHPHENTLQFVDSGVAKMSVEDDSTSFESDDAINELSEREQLECELIRRLIISYFSIVREMVQDQVPKSIMCLLVNYIKQHLQNRLVVRLYNESLFDELLQEDEGIQAEREKCVELLKTYREASAIISDVV
ncbi:dynamin-related protein Dnm1p [Diutina catenulata]